jgi:hypothetical protein
MKPKPSETTPLPAFQTLASAAVRGGAALADPPEQAFANWVAVEGRCGLRRRGRPWILRRGIFRCEKKEDGMKTMGFVLAGLLAAGFAAGRPMDIRSPNLEPSRGGKPRPPVTVPPDATNNLALACRVTASAEPTFQNTAEHQTPLGELPCVTDGDKEHDDAYVGLPPGKQWVQLDLGKTQEVWAVQVWHWYDYACVYRDVVVQLSNDPDFSDGVVTVFNNDHDNSAGLGIGRDKEYIETNEGRCLPVDGVCVRYLRFYSSGCTETPINRYTEIEVYGRAPVAVPQKDEPRVRLRIVLPKPIFT